MNIPIQLLFSVSFLLVLLMVLHGLCLVIFDCALLMLTWSFTCSEGGLLQKRLDCFCQAWATTSLNHFKVWLKNLWTAQVGENQAENQCVGCSEPRFETGNFADSPRGDLFLGHPDFEVWPLELLLRQTLYPFPRGRRAPKPVSRFTLQAKPGFGTLLIFPGPGPS